jgi:uncharacterized repeat protein (TIGR03843 family)
VPEDERQQRAAHLTSANFSYLVTVKANDDPEADPPPTPPTRAVYKPGRGERPLWDFGTDLYRREVAAYELSAAFGLDLVPETVVRFDGPLGPGSLQRFIEADFEQHYFTLVEQPELHPRLLELAAFDVLANNADRKSGHVLVDAEGQIWGIDNGLSFHADEKLRTVIWEFAGEPLPAAVATACEAIVADGAPRRVADLIGEAQGVALERRARAMLRAGKLPAPKDDYRAYPWPLV